jgi:hypothetical protein
LLAETGELGAGADGAYRVEPDTPASLSWSVVHPRVNVGGKAYDWDRSMTANAAFEGPRANRYKLHRLDQFGFDTFFDEARPGNASARTHIFETQAYIDGFRVTAAPMAAEATHGTLGIAVPVNFAPSCNGEFVYDAP